MTDKAASAVGVAIRRARESKGLTQGDLAQLLGKSQSAISFWEKGRRAPDFHDVIELIQHLDLNLDDLFAAAEIRREPAGAVLRAQAERVHNEELARAIDTLIEQAEALEPPSRELQISNDSPIAAAQELVAKAVVNQPPVDVVALAERCGARVLQLEASDGISGILLELDSGPVIGYAVDETVERQRFTVAHELGHHLLRHYDHFHIDPDRTASDGDPPGYDWQDERAANEFAAQLLMPATWIAESYRKTQAVADLAERFRVSQVAMGYRLANLGLR